MLTHPIAFSVDEKGRFIVVEIFANAARAVKLARRWTASAHGRPVSICSNPWSPPNARIAQDFETLVVSLKSGARHTSVVKSENATELVLNSLEDGLLKLRVADIARRECGQSAMTSERGPPPPHGGG